MLTFDEFKQGCYYKLIWENHIWYFKFKFANSRQLDVFPWVITNGQYAILGNSIILLRDDDIYEEVDFYEIVNYLPHGHPDVVEYRKKKINLLLNL